MSAELIAYTEHLADTCLVMGHRLSEWTGHGPMLEQDIAISNIALDMIGQARNFYQYAAKKINEENRQDDDSKVTEDSLAYFRNDREYRNLLMVETHNGDWGKTIMKLFLLSSYHYLLFEKLASSGDDSVAAIAAKSLKEVKYHRRWSGEWVVRLGDGTLESRNRMQNSLEELWPYTSEFFEVSNYEKKCIDAGIGTDPLLFKDNWEEYVASIFSEATLQFSSGETGYHKTGGKKGLHTEELGFLLAEMQYMQRAYPGCEW